MAYFKRKQKLLSVRVKIIFIVLIMIVGVLIADARIRPLLISAVKIQGINQVQVSVYSVAREKLKEKNLSYSDIVKISKSEKGFVTSVETDISSLGQLTGDISVAAIEALKGIDNSYITVPSGLLSGISFLSGSGFQMKFRIKSGNHITANVSSDFKSAGINQTLHTITLNLKATVTVFVAGGTVSETVPIDLILAQTVIVGEVPQSFSDINLISDIYKKSA